MARSRELDSIAEAAARAVGAPAAAILLACRSGRRHVGGEWASSDRYRRPPERRAGGEPGSLPLAAATLRLTGEVVGTLEVYGADPPARDECDLGRLAHFAERAATAVRVSRLAARQRRQSVAIERTVRNLRRQIHEQANRLHVVGALISIGEAGEARRFVTDLMDEQERLPEALVGTVEEQTLAGLLLGEVAIAREQGIVLEVDVNSQLSRIPGALAENEWLSLVGGLLEFAVEGLEDLPERRRHAVFGVRDGGDEVVLRVRDPARPLEPPLHSPAEALLREAVSAVDGRLMIDASAAGTLTTVRVPA